MSHSKLAPSDAHPAASSRLFALVALAPDENSVNARIIDAVVHDELEPATGYEALLVTNLVVIEREITLNRQRSSSILASATRAALIRTLSLRADEPDIAALGAPDDVARSLLYGTGDLRTRIGAELESVGIIVAEMADEAFLDRFQVLGELRREAGQLERRRRLLHQDIADMQSDRVLQNARPVGGS